MTAPQPHPSTVDPAELGYGGPDRNADVPSAAPVYMHGYRKVTWDNPSNDPNNRTHVGDDPTGSTNSAV